MLSLRTISICLATWLVGWCVLDTAFAQQQQVFISEPTGVANGWSTAPILTRGETVPLLGGPGNFVWASEHAKFDGLGAYRFDTDTLRVYVNHENTSGGISRVDLNVPLLKTWISNRVIGNNNSNYTPKPAGLVEGVAKAWTSVAGGLNQNLTLDRPCSGNVWEANTFGSGFGFTDRLYLTGEETFASTGYYYAVDTSTNTLHRASDVGGLGSWENATLIDTGRTDTVALLLGEDRGSSSTGTARLGLYVGLKNSGSSDFLERNGLKGGKTYYWDANGTSNTNGTLTTGGLFANNNDTISGTWNQTLSQAVLFSKAEDVHTNMQTSSAKFGKEAVLSSESQAIFHVDLSNVTFTAGDIVAGSVSDIKVLLKAGTANTGPSGTFGNFSGFDNLVWSEDGNLYVNEDDGEGDIWQIKPSSLLTEYQLGNLTPSINDVFQILDADSIGTHTGGLSLGITESSGIIDISKLVNYAPGSIFLTNGMGSTRDQIALMVSPTAVIPEPSAIGLLALAAALVINRLASRRR